MNYYFVSIAGTAMASAAVALQELGHRVEGSDEKAYPPMSDILATAGIKVYEGYLPEDLSEDTDIFVIGNAVSRGNPQVEMILEKKKRFISLPELIKNEFIFGRRSLVITGTHGKTTTTSIAAFLLHATHEKAGWLIGGKPESLPSSAKAGEKLFVIEGDEYDSAFFDKRSKFIHYLPDVLVINNLEFDHADIFDSLRDIQKSFRHLIRTVPRTGNLIVNGDDPNVAEILNPAYCPITRYGFEDHNDWILSGLAVNSAGMSFTLTEKHSQKTFLIKSPIIGKHNAMNLTAAFLGASFLSGKQPESAIDKYNSLIQNFRGVRKRLTPLAENLYDDFAHHPTAIKTTLDALRLKHPKQKILAMFEPRSNTSVQNVHQEALIEALAMADVVILGPLYREELIPPEKKLNRDYIVQKLKERGVDAVAPKDKTEAEKIFRSEFKTDTVGILMSNGGWSLSSFMLDKA